MVMLPVSGQRSLRLVPGPEVDGDEGRFEETVRKIPPAKPEKKPY